MVIQLDIISSQNKAVFRNGQEIKCELQNSKQIRKVCVDDRCEILAISKQLKGVSKEHTEGVGVISENSTFLME